MINRLASLILILLLFPIFIFIAILIFFDDGFPIFFKQKRVGFDNALFQMLKFRTMKKNTPDIPTHLLIDSKKNYTAFGPILRKSSLDELPQLINIIMGDMVFIGPRPALHNQKDLIALRKTKDVHKIYPGITGWAQVNGRDELDIKSKVEMDYYYLKNKSFYLNLKILFLTLIKVIRKEGVAL